VGYIFALASNLMAWVFAPLYAIAEVMLWFGTAKQNRSNGTISLVAPLVPILLAGCTLAAIGMKAPTAAWRPFNMTGQQGRFAGLIRSTFKHLQSPVIITDMPEKISVSPMFNTDGAVLYDPQFDAISSIRISGGELKRRVANSEMQFPLYRYNRFHDRFTVMPLDFDAKGASRTDFDAVQIAGMSQPPISFIKTVSLDETAKDLTIRSETPSTGPVLRVTGHWVNPIVQDYLWIDAKIDAPDSDKSSIELYWITALEPEFERRFHRIAESVVTNDGQYHKYLFPLQSTAWYSSGYVEQLTFGFPKGSTVKVKGMGTLSSEAVSPQYVFNTNEAKRQIAAPDFAFPNSPNLGLCIAPPRATSVPIKYSISPEIGATGLMFELSLPGRDFENPNGTRLSGVTWKTIPVEGTNGEGPLNFSVAPEPGIYAIRAIGMDKGHNFVGRFGDTAYLLIPHDN
jgi:hypothetical protein